MKKNEPETLCLLIVGGCLALLAAILVVNPNSGLLEIFAEHYP